jgi:hypothetical protein
MFPPERAPNVARLHATIQTQTIHVPPSCSQRHGGNSRQTDLAKLASQQLFCNGLRAFATRFCLCLSPASNGSNVPPGLSVGPSQVLNPALPVACPSAYDWQPRKFCPGFSLLLPRNRERLLEMRFRFADVGLRREPCNLPPPPPRSDGRRIRTMFLRSARSRRRLHLPELHSARF